MFQSPFPSRGTTLRHIHPDAQQASFNPRSPRGERPVSPLNIHGGYWFQSPFPRGGRLYDTRFTKQFFKFQSPFPVRGTTLRCYVLGFVDSAFQSPFPVRGTTVYSRTVKIGLKFQSPFPVRGTTRFARVQSTYCKGFNPRSP